MNKPDTGFYHLGIAPDMIKVLDRLKFVTPTPIQQQAIPIALEGKDIMGVAQTGTGKTLAFGIPIVQHLASEGGQALILVPTRELALQVADALEPLLIAFRMKSVVLIGGVKLHGQVTDIKRDPDILIATPGRMNDHIYLEASETFKHDVIFSVGTKIYYKMGPYGEPSMGALYLTIIYGE